jgi:hypothetical protein
VGAKDASHPSQRHFNFGLKNKSKACGGFGRERENGILFKASCSRSLSLCSRPDVFSHINAAMMRDVHLSINPLLWLVPLAAWHHTSEGSNESTIRIELLGI